MAKGNRKVAVLCVQDIQCPSFEVIEVSNNRKEATSFLQGFLSSKKKNQNDEISDADQIRKEIDYSFEFGKSLHSDNAMFVVKLLCDIPNNGDVLVRIVLDVKTLVTVSVRPFGDSVGSLSKETLLKVFNIEKDDVSNVQVIASVAPGSDASIAGFKPGDILLNKDTSTALKSDLLLANGEEIQSNFPLATSLGHVARILPLKEKDDFGSPSSIATEKAICHDHSWTPKASPSGLPPPASIAKISTRGTLAKNLYSFFERENSRDLLPFKTL